MPFTLRLTQQDLSNPNNTRWLTVRMTTARVVSPIAGKWPPEWNWLAVNPEFHLWGRWSVESNSTNLRADESYAIGTARPDRRGWRYSLSSTGPQFDIQFVENSDWTDGVNQTDLVAALYSAYQGARSCFYPMSGGVGTGFVDFGGNIFRKGSISWRVESVT